MPSPPDGRLLTRLGKRSDPDDDVRLAADDRCDEARYELGSVLPVAVEMDDDVRARGQRCVHAASESSGQPTVAPVALDVVGAGRERDRRRRVGGAVIDDDDLDLAAEGCDEAPARRRTRSSRPRRTRR